MPTVSVIMGVYNCKNIGLLKKSVDSIINQTFQDWEFLICNDGSTDDTFLELKKLESMDSRIKVLTYEKNRGLNHALNVCIQAAKGEYIARQDDDDISKPNRFQKQVEFLESHLQYSILGTCADVFDDDGIWGKYEVIERPEETDFFWNSPFMHPTMMMRKRDILTGGGTGKQKKHDDAKTTIFS